MDSYHSKDTNECYLQNDSDVNFLQAAHILAGMQQTLSHIEMLSKFQVIPAYFHAHVRKVAKILGPNRLHGGILHARGHIPIRRNMDMGCVSRHSMSVANTNKT